MKQQAAGDSIHLGKKNFWHPFSDMRTVSQERVVIERGDGVWIWDSEGKRYLDGTAGLWYCFVGYGREELIDAATRQMRMIPSYSSFGDLTTRSTLELAEKIASISPLEDTAVFFTSGGSESVETGAKLAKRYWNAIGRPEKRILVTRGQAYHGVGGFGTSMAGIAPNAAGYGPLLPDVLVTAPDDVDALARLFEEKGDQIAAFFGEPVRGAGGLYPPMKGYWKEVERLCRKHDILLVCDEVITGFGRLGEWFASTAYDLQPDIILGAKGVTSGYLPLGVVLCGPRVQEPFWKGSAGMFRHGYTYSGHATACAVGVANLELMEKENVVARAASMAGTLRMEMSSLLDHPLVKEVRCEGMLGAVELTGEAREAVPNLLDQALLELRKHEVMSRVLLGHSLQFSPALVISQEEIRFMVKGIRAGLDALGARLPELAAAR